MRNKIKAEKLAGRTPLQAALDLLQAAEWSYVPFTSPDGTLRRLFFAHPGSIELAKIFNHVCILDSTYKTNRFNLPLLQAVSHASTGQTFTIAFCLLGDEDEKNYLWAMEQLSMVWKDADYPAVFVTDHELALTNAIDLVFPDARRLLCYWHIAKNLKKACRHFCPTDKDWDAFSQEFKQLCFCKTEEEFNQKWEALRGKLYLSSRSTLDYLETNVITLKEHFCGPWAVQVPHFGNAVTSRAESAHASIKGYLTDSQGLFPLVSDMNVQFLFWSFANGNPTFLCNCYFLQR